MPHVPPEVTRLLHGRRGAEQAPPFKRKESFVATATAIGLIVDAARVPVYLFTEGSNILRIWPLPAAATVGAVAGTVAGWQALRHVPERAFRRLVALLLLALGVAMIMGIGA
jgi:uncharacterized membrane protein YfcA